MKKVTLILLALGFLIGGIGYWTADFSDDRVLFNSLAYIKAPGAFLISIIAGFIWKKEPARNALAITFGVLLGMFSRILADIIQDSSSHNLFPIELLIGSAFILPVTFLGSYLVYGIFRIAGKN